MKVCEVCGSQEGDRSRVCGRCGAMLPVHVNIVMQVKGQPRKFPMTPGPEMTLRDAIQALFTRLGIPMTPRGLVVLAEGALFPLDRTIRGVGEQLKWPENLDLLLVPDDMEQVAPAAPAPAAGPAAAAPPPAAAMTEGTAQLSGVMESVPTTESGADGESDELMAPSHVQGSAPAPASESLPSSASQEMMAPASAGGGEAEPATRPTSESQEMMSPRPVAAASTSESQEMMSPRPVAAASTSESQEMMSPRPAEQPPEAPAAAPKTSDSLDMPSVRPPGSPSAAAREDLTEAPAVSKPAAGPVPDAPELFGGPGSRPQTVESARPAAPPASAPLPPPAMPSAPPVLVSRPFSAPPPAAPAAPPAQRNGPATPSVAAIAAALPPAVARTKTGIFPAMRGGIRIPGAAAGARGVTRHVTLRWFKRMNSGRVYPLTVLLARPRLRDDGAVTVSGAIRTGTSMVSGAIRTSSTMITAALAMDEVHPAQPYVTIRPLLPGCVCYPAEQRADISPDPVTVTFQIVPQLAGPSPAARVEFHSEKRRLGQVPLPIEVAGGGSARMLAAIACLWPFLCAAVMGLYAGAEQPRQLLLGLLANLLRTPFAVEAGLSALALAAVLAYRANRPLGGSEEADMLVAEPMAAPELMAAGRQAGAEKRWREAMSYFESAIDAAPRDPAARAGLAWARRHAESPELALESLTEALSQDVADAEVFYQVGCCWGALGNADQALHALSEAVRQGFSDSARMFKEPDLAGLRDKPLFRTLAVGQH